MTQPSARSDHAHHTDNALSLVVEFEADVAAVWAAWTTPELMSWFGSDPKGTVLAAAADVHVGGDFRVSFQNSDGSGFVCCGTYLRVDPPRSFESTWGWAGRDHVERIRVTLHPHENGTRMAFEHLDIDPHTSHGYAEGWLSCFGKLEASLRQAEFGGGNVE